MSGRRRGQRTGWADVDPLIEIAETEQAHLEDALVVSQAEGVVAAVHRDDLVAQQQAAYRRLSAAKGRLTRARKDGSAEKIAAAAARLQAAHAEANRISEHAISQLHDLSTARLEEFGDVMAQMRRSWDAGAAVIEALTHPSAHRPTAKDDR